MKNLIKIIFVIFILLSGCGENRQTLSVDRLERLSELVTLKIHVADVLQAEGKRVTGAWLVKGDALVAVDMSRAKITDKGGNRVDIRLPEPRVIQPRVDHSRTITYDVKSGLFTSGKAESRMRDEAMKQAQRLVEQAAGSADNIKTAKERAELLITAFFEELGWRVRIIWI